MPKPELKRFTNADEQREFPRGHADMVHIAGGTVGRLSFEPGWRWSEHVKPIAGTELCEAPHFQYHLSGVLHIVNDDGSEFDAKTGDVTSLPTHHDAWVVGDEPVVVVDWAGATRYAQ
ncbi:MAG: cupin domain-containing protein [Dehalococcoidia bacterium]|nr:cupin domain-containing protein [Dehalococcoidia bacterium]